MWMEPLSQLMIAVTLLGQSPAFTPLPKPIVFQQSAFAIPFRVDRVDDPARQPIEIQLHVSIDRGQRWQLYAKAPPTQQHFQFRAGGNGEYWFAIRVVDRSGQVRPETIAGPALRVIVDARSPETGRPVQRTAQPRPTVPQSDTPPKGPSPQSDPAAGPSLGPRDQAVARPATKPDQTAAFTADPKGSVAIAINPAIGRNFSTGNPTREADATIPGLPPGERPRMVNSRRFQLEYDVDSVGPSGIGRVELWGTRDGGKNWRSFNTANDGHNTLLVNVQEDGIYGFRVVVTNGVGLGGKPPTSGDSPDLWVGVDQTKPTAKIVSAKQGKDTESGQLIIAWQADDQMLAARPVSLSFSSSRSGPWLPIASGLENTGRYAWSVDHRTPAQLYLRLEVRDEAGNLGVHEMDEPVTIDQSRPTIRVREVRPVKQTGARSVQRSARQASLLAIRLCLLSTIHDPTTRWPIC